MEKERTKERLYKTDYMEPFVPIPPPGNSFSLFFFLLLSFTAQTYCPHTYLSFLCFLIGQEPWVPDEEQSIFDEPMWVTEQRMEWLETRRRKEEFRRMTRDHSILYAQNRKLQGRGDLNKLKKKRYDLQGTSSYSVKKGERVYC